MTIVEAGRMSPKNSPWTVPIAPASAGSVMNMRVRTTSEAEPPSSSIAARMMANTRRVWAVASPGVDDPSGSTGAVPETRMRSPTRIAREKPIEASNGDEDWVEWRSDSAIRRAFR